MNRYEHPICATLLVLVAGPVLEEGNVASTDDWRLVLEPIVARYRDLDICPYRKPCPSYLMKAYVS